MKFVLLVTLASVACAQDAGLSIHPPHVRVDLSQPQLEDIVVTCLASQSLKECQFKIGDSRFFNVSEEEYSGAGLKVGECGMRLQGITFSWEGAIKIVSCRVLTQSGDWLTAATSVFSSKLPGLALTTASRHKTVDTGSDVSVSYHAPGPVTDCSFKVNREKAWRTLTDSAQACTSGDYCYYGRGFLRGDCGVTIRNVNQTYNTTLLFRVKNETAVEVDFIKLNVTDVKVITNRFADNGSLQQHPTSTHNIQHPDVTMNPTSYSGPTAKAHDKVTSEHGPASYIALLLGIIYMVIQCFADFVKFASRNKRWRCRLPKYLIREGSDEYSEESAGDRVVVPASLTARHEISVESKRKSPKTRKTSGKRQQYNLPAMKMEKSKHKADRVLGNPTATKRASDWLARRDPIAAPTEPAAPTDTTKFARSSMTSFGAPTSSLQRDRYYDPRKIPIVLNSPSTTLRRPTTPKPTPHNIPSYLVLTSEEGYPDFHKTVDKRPLVSTTTEEGSDTAVYGNISTLGDTDCPTYGNVSALDDKLPPVYVNLGAVDDRGSPFYGNTEPFVADYGNDQPMYGNASQHEYPFYGNTGSIEDNDQPVYGNTITMDEDEQPIYGNCI